MLGLRFRAVVMTPHILAIVRDYASLGVTHGAEAVRKALEHRHGTTRTARTVGRHLAALVEAGELVQERRGVRLSTP